MPRTVTIASQTAHLAEVRRFVRGCAAEAGLSERTAAQVQLAVDEAVVPRSRWDATVPEAGARLEIVTAVQGG